MEDARAARAPTWDFVASAGCSADSSMSWQQLSDRATKLAEASGAPPSGLGALVSDLASVDGDGDGAVGLHGIFECLSQESGGSKLQAAKTPWAPPGLIGNQDSKTV